MGYRQSGCFKAVKTMPVTHQYDADAPAIINPRKTAACQYKFRVKQIFKHGNKGLGLMETILQSMLHDWYFYNIF